mmetsp:Transcript_18038/g.68069  ORF Transcript_18038/g.68069 Transcript_18038/m.68069 type:complete len:278 (-) Transcript_18038:8-841(-)
MEQPSGLLPAALQPQPDVTGPELQASGSVHVAHQPRLQLPLAILALPLPAPAAQKSALSPSSRCSCSLTATSPLQPAFVMVAAASPRVQTRSLLGEPVDMRAPPRLPLPSQLCSPSPRWLTRHRQPGGQRPTQHLLHPSALRHGASSRQPRRGPGLPGAGWPALPQARRRPAGLRRGAPAAQREGTVRSVRGQAVLLAATCRQARLQFSSSTRGGQGRARSMTKVSEPTMPRYRGQRQRAARLKPARRRGLPVPPPRATSSAALATLRPQRCPCTGQ